MQAVILAAGKGTRMHPLQTPKPLLKIAGRPLLEHALYSLEGIEEIVLVVGHESQQLREYCNDPRVRFVEQKEQSGTYHALLQAKPFLKDRFLVMNGDDLYSLQDVRSCLKHDLAILAKEVAFPQRFGIIEHSGSSMTRILEKPANPPSNLANTGMFVLNTDVFTDPPRSQRGEFELTDAVSSLASGQPVSIVKSESWIPIGYPWNLLEANELLMSSLKSSNQGTVEQGAVLKGPVQVGRGTLVKSGSYIEGPVIIGSSCQIGPNCCIRPGTVLGDNCRIGNAVEIKNSLVGDNVSIKHLSYFADSVIGSGASIGAGTVAANLRHDKQSIHVLVNGEKIDTGRRKFGCVIAEGVKTGIHTSIYPGRKLVSDTFPREIVA